MNRFRMLSRVCLAPAVALGLAACADRESSVFDPTADQIPPTLTNFGTSALDDGSGNRAAYALWSADEPVRVVIEYGPVGTPRTQLPLHSYALEREYAAEGLVKLVGAAPNTDYAYVVRMWDRAGNESSMFMESTPQFTTDQDVDVPPLFLLAMIDVGWGDALFIRAPDGTQVLIDAGHPKDAVEVMDFFDRLGVTYLDFASLSHVHEDHIGGFYGDGFLGIPGVLNQVPIGKFIDIEEKTMTNGPYSTLSALLEPLDKEGRHVRLKWGESTETTDVLDWGDGVRVDLLAAGRKPFLIPEFIINEEPGSVINNDSMVYRVQYGSFVAIVTGDAEFAAEQFMQNHWSRDFLNANVLKLGHHGSNDSNSERHIDGINPQIGLITNAISENPGVEHPFVLNRLRNRNIDYYASDRVIPNRDRALPGVRGDVLIWTDGSAFTVEVQEMRFE